MIKQYEYQRISEATNGSSICHAFNEAYNSNRSNASFPIPKEIGNGQMSWICGSRGTRIIDCNLNFLEPIEVCGVSRTPHMDMLFSLGDNMNMELPQGGKEFQLLSGESYIGAGYETMKRSVYPAQRDLHLIEVKMPLAEIQEILESIPIRCNSHCSSSANVPSGKYKITPSIQVIVQQMLKCPYEDPLRQLYIEGKVLELIAVYLNEAVYQAEKVPDRVNLSVEDMKSMYLAKNILDRNLSEAPSLNCLSKRVFLNEYKLKKGFKELFGLSIHSYVINQRLELAKFLLEEKNLNVSNVASRVGYGNVSHFAAAFRKKFSVNPSDYLQDIKK